MKKLLFGVATCLLLFGFALSQVNAQPVVVPNANEFVEGNSSNNFPFNSTSFTMRYQQIYESTQFSECGNIVQVNFRFTEGVLGDSITYPDILIQLSTTNVTPATLSTTFADNIGLNVITVYEGELSFAAQTCDSGPCPFENTITLQTPFNYNPSDGNLLLDISVPQTSGGYQSFDVVDNMPSITRRVVATSVGDDIGVVSDIALVTQFVCELIPTFINLSPNTATNDVLTEHTVIATIETDEIPEPGILVTFEVISGPNAGEMSDPGNGECSINDDCTTDENGQVSWTYTGSKFPGTDTIVAFILDEIIEEEIESNAVEKIWVFTRNVPTLSEWGLISMAALLGIVGFMVIRRRKVAA